MSYSDNEASNEFSQDGAIIVWPDVSWVQDQVLADIAANALADVEDTIALAIGDFSAGIIVWPDFSGGIIIVPDIAL